MDQLPDAVELILSSGQVGAKLLKLIVFDYHSEVDDEREAVENARARLADAAVTVEPLADLLERGKTLPATRRDLRQRRTDPLALLIYTSGSTGAPKGAMYPQANVGKMWRRSAATGSAKPPRRSPSTSCR